MLDFCMCNNIDCKSKNECLRYLCVSAEYQTYATFSEDIKNVNKRKCEYYIRYHKNDHIQVVTEADEYNNSVFMY